MSHEKHLVGLFSRVVSCHLDALVISSDCELLEIKIVSRVTGQVVVHLDRPPRRMHVRVCVYCH